MGLDWGRSWYTRRSSTVAAAASDSCRYRDNVSDKVHYYANDLAVTAQNRCLGIYLGSSEFEVVGAKLQFGDGVAKLQFGDGVLWRGRWRHQCFGGRVHIFRAK